MSFLRIAVLFPVFLFALQFTQAPSLTPLGDGQWQASFAVDETTDVEVSIVDPYDSVVVRHLAAGLLGSNPPPPLAANSLGQSLTWDGKDDFGAAAWHPESLTVRVRAGLKPRLVHVAGENLDFFQGYMGGIVPDGTGSIIVYGQQGGASFIRKYDAAGRYLQTLFPPAAGLPADQVTAYGINVFPEGGWAPKTVGTPNEFLINITGSFVNRTNSRLVPVGDAGEAVLLNGMDIQVINGATGALNRQGRIITGPAFPTTSSSGATLRGPFGPKVFTLAANPSYFYLSGFYFGELAVSSELGVACTTGFWADGQVFRVDRATGIATSWLRMDSIPDSAAIREKMILEGDMSAAPLSGTAIDDSGHVFVCDRLHNRIAVYDTNAVLLGEIPCRAPTLVSVSRRTKIVYVVTQIRRYPVETSMMLMRYRDWRDPGTPVSTPNLVSYFSSGTKPIPSMVVTERDGETYIWLGNVSLGLRIYRDDVTALTVVKDFSADMRVNGPIFERIAVDRRTDKLYWQNLFTGGCYGSSLYSISDWASPRIEQTTVGGGYPADIAVGPTGNLYLCPTMPYGFNRPVLRYTPGLQPLNYPTTQKNWSTPQRYSQGSNLRGHAVSWQGKIAFYNEIDRLLTLPDTGCSDTSYVTPNRGGRGDAVVMVNGSAARPGVSGVKFDPAGNLYVGAFYQGPDWMKIPGLENDNRFLSCGSIVKVAPGDTVILNTTHGLYSTVDYPDKPTLAGRPAKVYAQPFGSFADGCTCRNPRFEVDAYGRLYIPCPPANRVAVVDNAGNSLVDLGKYGNTDSRGGLAGPGLTSAEPAVPLAWPTSVAVSEDYIYIGDGINARILRLKMDYALENVDITGTEIARAGFNPVLTMTAEPNPFNPATVFRFTVAEAGRARLSVFDLAGRLVRTLETGAAAPGTRELLWNGRDNDNRPMASGVYFARIAQGRDASRMVKVTLVR